MQTKNNLVDNDDFDPDEAIEAAVEKRKFLIKRLQKDYIYKRAAMMKTINIFFFK